MASTAIPRQALERIRESLNGDVIAPGDPSYDDARRVHNGAIDRRPAAIARCRTTGDVVRALAFAREQGLEVSVRGGGHNVAGRAVVDDALMIDLSPMKGIRVDPERRVAHVEPGVTWGELNDATGEHGLATTGGVISTTGVAGLTVGGGLGFLMAKHGMVVDNLLSAEVVLADGRVVTASEESEPDLFWAIRGGGGNFGIVTSFTYRLHPVKTVTAGLVAHPFDRAGEVLRFYRDLTTDLPDEVTAFGGVVHAPDGSGAKLSAIVLCDCRPPGTDDAVVRRVKAFGEPLVDAIEPMPYADANRLLDGGYPAGAHNYWKSSFLEALTDEAIDTMVACFADAPSPMDAILIEHFHGAATRVPVEATAFPHRQEGYNLAVLSEWMDPGLGESCVAWARTSYDDMQGHFAPARFMNYLGEDDTAAENASAYGPNLPRLQRIKAEYDPENVFRANLNIQPA